MKRTKFDLLLTNAVNILLFIGVFMFGYWRWQKLENIIIESTNSQEQYRIIHAALKSTIQLDHLGEQVSEWSPTDSADYQQKLAETNNSLDGLRKYYSKSQIDSMQNVLNQKGHLLSEIYATIVKRNENDEHLRQDRQVTVKDTETYVKHYTGHVFRSSREEVTSRSKNRTVTVPSVNELAFLDKELYTISLSVLSDSLAEVNRWLDINVSQMLDAEDAKAERKQKELMDRASGIGKTTFRWGMLFLIFVALLNVANTWRRSKVMKELEKESDKNKKLVEKRRQMMYAVVHDLRTPLSIVIGYNDMAKQCPTKNEKYISAISFSARQLRGMIDQLLDYFRLESNKGMLKPRDFSLMELANELTNSFELRADERLIEFVKPKVQGIVLNGDYEKICHIATNLLDNAFKFTRKGSVELGISYADDMLNIKVSDTGIGIKDEDKERVFSAFTRFSNAVATGKEGFGIGLSTVKMLVDLMKGKIDFESSDKGTTFYVSLPMKIAESKGDAVVAEVMKASEERKHVLVVDDSNVWLLMIQGVLQQNGFDCDVCSDTAKFFTMLRKGNYSAVIMDLQMPGKNGRELLDVMRESKVANSQTVPVIVSTASGEDVREELLKVGFDEYLPKTADISEMVNVVNQVIAEKSKTVTPDFTKLRKSVAGYLIEETEDAVAGLHNAIKTMDFDEMRKWAHCLKTSWLLYRVSILVDPIMEVARSKDMSANNRLVTYMAEIDKMAKIIITKAKEIRDTRDE
ncbi:MAG: hybrid sensor histidine kinase/response regulator [Prevotella sp.]|nr:hybrid sensor histidine kinase/response regulator [Prevotella sp.]